MLVFALWSVLLTVVTQAVDAQVTVYGQTPLAHQAPTSTEGAPPVETLAAYNQLVLTPPAPPQPPVTANRIEVPPDAANFPGLSIPHTGASFFGFSIEMSVITQTVGKNSTHIFPPFLNLMSNIIERAGDIMIRFGGNTQEYAKYHEGTFDDGRITQKEASGSTQTTETPAVMYTIDMFYMMANISAMLNIGWFVGLPFDDITVFDLNIAMLSQEILGDKLIALQSGNEPDLYGRHGKRPMPYVPENYNQELERLFVDIDANERITVKDKFVAPSISHSEWTPEQVWETGFIERFRSRLWALTVERYPNNNCFAQFGTGSYQDPQENFPTFLSHDMASTMMQDYVGSSRLAQEAGLPFIMFETNTASCGGFPGISQSYGAGLWVLDYGLLMAHNNFSNALLHVGGQNVFYNPWISPPTNQSAFNEWTVGSVFYSALIMAEVFGKSGTGRVVDMGMPSPFTPAYAIYENNRISKFALFNFIDDPSGANTVSTTLFVDGGVPAYVRVKWFLAESVASKTNITWAGQTFGNNFEADGRLKGDLNVETIQCNQATSECVIPLRAPSFALVMLDEGTEVANLGQATATFATTAFTKGRNTATYDPKVLETSNGHSWQERQRLGSTSHGSVQRNDAARRYGLVSTAAVVISLLVGGLTIMMAGVRRR